MTVKHINLIIFYFINIVVYGQIKIKNPNTVLNISTRYQYLGNIDTVDFNCDGKKDLIVYYNSHKLKIGDTTFIAIYDIINDSTFKLIHRFGNLLGPYCTNWREEKNLNNDCYLLSYPESATATFFNTGKVELFFYYDAISYVTLKFELKNKRYVLTNEARYMYIDGKPVAEFNRPPDFNLFLEDFNIYDFAL